ncbi:ladderlectin-like, partial [Oryzias melastigma]|uniref:ladderlectin-like n=1 Tax=Oryzias melastigma TaxID=30732 RepID=UPI00168D3C27
TNCRSMGGNLASVHSIDEYHEIQTLIMSATHEPKKIWIGGSNAQEDDVWLWSDGSTFRYTNWCSGEPNNRRKRQHCLQMNHSSGKCWDDVECWSERPYICAKKI